MSLLKFNIRRYTYLFLGWGFYSSVFILFATIAYKSMGSVHTFGSYMNTGFGFLFAYVIFFLFAIILEHSMGKNNFTFLYVPILTSKVLKNIYHIDLGYFTIGINSKEHNWGGVTFDIDGYDQKFLYMKRIFHELDVNEINGDIISRKIKSKLEDIFKEKIREEKEKEARKVTSEYNIKVVNDAKAKLKEWDGFLDKRSRRDGIIDRTLN